jgi:hypothetical protein
MRLGRVVAFAIVIVAASMIALLHTPAERVAPDEANDKRLHDASVQVAYPPALLAAEPPTAAAPADVMVPNAIELCGYGKVNPDDLPSSLEGVASPVLLGAVDKFVSARDQRKQALGLATRASVEAEAADRGVVASDPKKCAETALCEEQAADAFTRGATPSIEALAALASGTQDPAIYVMAMRACRSILPGAPPSGCGVLSVDQWTRIDPDNAMPWLLSAREAKKRWDDASFQDALLHASRAKFFDRRLTPYGDILAGIDEHAEPLRTLIVARLADADAREDPADYQSNFTVAIQYCQARSDPAGRAMCNDIGHVLLELSSDALAGNIGEMFTADWPAERVAAVRKRNAGLSMVRPGTIQPRPLGCDDAAKAEQRLIGVAKYGELGYAQQRASATPPR